MTHKSDIHKQKYFELYEVIQWRAFHILAQDWSKKFRDRVKDTVCMRKSQHAFLIQFTKQFNIFYKLVKLNWIIETVTDQIKETDQ